MINTITYLLLRAEELDVDTSFLDIELNTKVVATTAPLNIRNLPSLSGAVVGGLAKGTIVTIIIEQDGWGMIGENKWISLNFVRPVYRASL